MQPATRRAAACPFPPRPAFPSHPRCAAACPEGAGRAAYFLQLWTLKEAYVKALGRGISAPPGLRSFSFRVGGQQAAAAEALLWQQAAAGGAPALRQQGCEQPEGHRSAQPAAPAAAAAALAELDEPQQSNGSGTSAGASTSSSSSSSSSWDGSEVGGIQFSTAASDSCGWHFALLQPAPGHVAALCVEDSSDDCCSSDDDCGSSGGGSNGGSGQQGVSSLLLRSFTVQPAALLGSSGLAASAADPHLLAQGTYSPC